MGFRSLAPIKDALSFCRDPRRVCSLSPVRNGASSSFWGRKVCVFFSTHQKTWQETTDCASQSKAELSVECSVKALLWFQVDATPGGLWTHYVLADPPGVLGKTSRKSWPYQKCGRPWQTASGKTTLCAQLGSQT
jgi:hypothetical protein